MPVQPFAEWLPDQPQGAGALTITNVMPRTDTTYSPFPSPLVYSAAASERVQGFYSILDSQRQNFSFAGGATKLMRLNPGSGATWADVSKAGGYSGLPFSQGGMWSSTSFGDLVVFTNFANPVQSFNITSSTLFADLAAAAPHAYYCAVIRDFLMLGNTHDPIDLDQPRRVWWSSIGDPHDWPTPGTDLAIQRQSDFQDLEQSDLGHMRGIVGGNLAGADGAAIMERGIYRIVYAGSPAIFEFHVAEGASGSTSPASIATRRYRTQQGYRAVAYYLGEGGFMSFDGTSAIPIGAGKWDRAVIDDMEPARRFQTLGIATPNYELIVWAYIGKGTPAGAAFDLYNRLLVYNWVTGRAALCSIDPIEWIGRALTINLSLDDLDPYGNLETLPYSLDSPLWQQDAPGTAVFDSSHRLCYMNGPAMSPIVETAELGADARRSKLHGRARIVVEGIGGDSATLAVGHRERKTAAIVYDAAVPVDVLGNCPLRSSGRYVRMRVTIPAGLVWDHLSGVEVAPQLEGRLR